MKISAGMKKSLIVLASLMVILVLFIFLRSQDIGTLPSNMINESATDHLPAGAKNVGKFSDIKKDAAPKSNVTNVTNVKSTTSKKKIKPLPYPRISINYSIEKTRSIGSNQLDKNSTFLIVTLDIRNYGYTYFDAHQSKFRMGKNGEIRPLINVSTGKTIDAVLPNNSRVKGNLMFLVGKRVNQGTIKFVSTNTSESYTILYKKVSESEMAEVKQESADDEEWK